MIVYLIALLALVVLHSAHVYRKGVRLRAQQDAEFIWRLRQEVSRNGEVEL